jgi:tape measure domain-containing protein
MAEVDPVIFEFQARTNAFLANLSQTTRTVDQQIGRQEARVRKLEAEFKRSSGAIGGHLRGLAGTLATYFTGRELMGLVDNFTRLQNSLRVAGLDGQRLEQVQGQLLTTAQRYGVEINSLADLFGRATQAQRDLGASSDDMLQLTEATAQALKITGTNTAQASGAILGLTQALSSGIVRAEEFNQVNEGGLRPLLQVVAASDRWGGSVAKLRRDIADGNVTSDEFFRGILAGSQVLEGQASKATLTLSAGFTTLTNALTVYFGQADQANGASAALGEALGTLAENLDTVIKAMAVIGVAIGGRYVAGMLAGGVATRALVAHLQIATTSLAGTALAARSAGGALLGAFGGPVGLAITAVALGIGYLATESAKASAEAERLAAVSAKNEAQFLGLASAADKAGRETGELSDAQIIARSSALDLSVNTDKLADAHYRAAAAARVQRIEEQKLAVGAAARSALKVADRLRNTGPGNAAITSDPMDRKLNIQSSTGEFDANTARQFQNAPETKAFIRARAALQEMLNEPLETFAPPASGSPSGAATKASGTKARAATGPSAAEVQRRFEDELDGYRGQIASAMARQASTADEEAELSLRGVELARRQTLRSLEADENYSTAQKARLAATVEQVAAAEREAIDFQRRSRIERETADLADERFRAQADAMSLQYDLADTDAERKRLALAMVDAETDYLRSKLEAVAASTTAAEAEKERARIALQSLAATAGARREAAGRSNETDVERYLRDLRKTPGQINEAMDGIRIDGLEALNDGLTDAISGAKSLGEVFENVADQIVSDLVRIAIQQSVIKPLAESLFGGGGGAFGGLLGGLGGLLGFGGGPVSLLGGTPFGRASGGYVGPGQSVRVNEGASPGRVEAFMSRDGGHIIPLGRMNALQAGAGQAGGGVAVVRLELSGDIDARIQAQSAGVAIQVVRANAEAIADQGANKAISVLQRPRL